MMVDEKNINEDNQNVNEVIPEVTPEATPALSAAVTPEVIQEESGKRNNRKTKVGKVLSDKMDKSITVSVEKKVKHPLYKKFFKKTTKFMAHDEKNECKAGDIVKIMEVRPLSKNKRWRLVEIVEKAK
jgi:small subunit ribosomal protein S17